MHCYIIFWAWLVFGLNGLIYFSLYCAHMVHISGCSFILVLFVYLMDICSWKGSFISIAVHTVFVVMFWPFRMNLWVYMTENCEHHQHCNHLWAVLWILPCCNITAQCISVFFKALYKEQLFAEQSGTAAGGNEQKENNLVGCLTE